MKSKLFTSLLLQILCSPLFAQSNVPELTASSPITNGLAIYQGQTVVVVPLDEYKLDNIRLEQLMNALEQCAEVDSVKALRLANLEHIIVAKDSIITFKNKQISINQNIISQLQNDVNLQINKKTAWRNISMAILAWFAIQLIPVK